ncbi:MAG: hypothetical protein GEV00_12070 [Actinophytocola sp.]|nr:hypothetical protein [Actinophytocola sp.]
MRGTIGRHWLIATLLVAGAALRVLAWIGYQPALLYFDSFRYLNNLGVHDPGGMHPIGYDLLVLEPLLSVGGLELVTAVQHLAGLGCALGLYLLALRLRAPAWLAAIAAAPVLLDAYVVQIEQMIMSDTWQLVLLVAILWLLIGTGAPNPRRAALAGLLLGVAVAIRLIAVTLFAPAVVYLLIAGGAWRAWRSWATIRAVALRTGAFVVLFAVVVGSYATYYHQETGRVGLSNSQSDVLYSRAAVVAKCDQLPLTPVQRLACPTEPLGDRMPDYYAHRIADENWVSTFPEGTEVAEVQHQFGMIVLREQPFDVARAVAIDFLKGFRPARTDAPNDVSVTRWHFQPGYQYYDHRDESIFYSQKFSGETPSAFAPATTFLRGYQLSVGYTPGPLLAAFALVAIAAVFGVGRARGSGLRAAALLTVGTALIIQVGSSAFEFSWRYQLPGLVLLPIAGVIGIIAIWGRRPA